MSYGQQKKSNPMDGYITVAERIELFYKDHPKGRIIYKIMEHDSERGFVLIRARVYRNQEDTEPAATGHAYEFKDSSFVNKTSYIENAETSAVGRAIALLGYEIKRGIASREEMQKVERMQQSTAQPENVRQMPYSNAPKTVEKPVDGWLCGKQLEREILDLEAALDSKGVGSTVLRNALEKGRGTRNPATLSKEDAAKYRDYLKKKNSETNAISA
jgi:hypothetical protein